MKSRYFIQAGCLAVGLLALAGCDDDDKWAPGAASECVNQVYFIGDEPVRKELKPGESQTYTITLSREDATEAISVPLSVSCDSEFEVPSTVDFAAGEEEKDVTVVFKGADKSKDCSCLIRIPDGIYNNPYATVRTSVNINISVLNWILIVKNVSFHDDENYAYPAPLFPDFQVDLYKAEGKEKYRFVNFMEGYDLTFSLAVYSESEKNGTTYYMQPENGSYGEDYYGYPAWFFDTAGGEESFPLYMEALPGYYFDWGFFYVNDESANYTCINFQGRYGNLYGYIEQYDMNGNYVDYEYFYIVFSWTEEDEVHESGE